MGAALSPTDPAFASAIIGREEVPGRVRALLNIESGLNDGLALPVVMALLPQTGRARSGWLELVLDIAGGIALGVAMPWIAMRLEKSRLFGAAVRFQPFAAVAIALMMLAIARATGVNEFLAAFVGGATLARVGPETAKSFQKLGEQTAELIKLAALLIFGSLISIEGIRTVEPAGLLFVLLALVAVRPAALALALMRTGLSWREWVTVAWFGPKGFATVLFSLLILRTGMPGARPVFRLLALVAAASIVAHSSTDVPIARWFRKQEAEAPESAGPGQIQ